MNEWELAYGATGTIREWIAAAPRLQPEGVCPSCDRRRKEDRERVARFRAKGRSDGK